MAELDGRYTNLPYLDVTDQPTGSNAYVNGVKREVRLAINANRVDDMAMRELITLLEHSLTHIQRASGRVKTKRTRKLVQPAL